ncbi:Antimicrobial peptide MBP-1 related (LEM1) [Medicago truncatula]|uniref:Antimicrobial peptide MBP-1 related (LEM1) n=1 Tax=Medicago truncatula TaxID=3880 RepID=A0A072U1H5_MEDTR|nr:Antimicrobial peptide MBP-1 related (LEM1) [Medicago truncatula]
MILILGMLMLISLATAEEVGLKANLVQCLSKCGDDVISCVTGCYSRKVENFLGCAMNCEGADALCMTSCASTLMPPSARLVPLP